MVDKIQGVQLGSKAGDGELDLARSPRLGLYSSAAGTLTSVWPLSGAVFGALAILLPLLTNHSGATKPSWSYNVSVLTDGQSIVRFPRRPTCSRI